MKRLLIAAFLLAPFAVAKEDAKAAPKRDANTARIAEIKVKLSGTEDPHGINPFGRTPLNFRGFLKLIERAAHDPDLDGVLLKSGGYGVGYARLLEAREALKQLRRSGKKVFFYAESMSTPDLLIASVADRVSMPESGTLMIPGALIDMFYMKGLLDKLHIRFDVVHIGDYKTAGESLVRDSMSKAQRESLEPILDEFYDSMVKAIAESRGIAADQVKRAIDKGILNAREAKALGLIDRVEYEDQFKEGMQSFFAGKKIKRAGDYKRKGKLDIDPNNPFAAMQAVMTAMLPKKEQRKAGDKIAIIYCTGAITSGKSQYDWSGNVSSMGSKTIVKAIDKARKDKSVKALVLRINSPGGSGLASDMIWRAIERAKRDKIVIASMGDVAASGGYYIAMNSHVILAEPQTITGSIGVVGIVPNMSGFYSWVGLNPQRIERGKRAGAWMGTRPLDDSDRQVLRDYMKEFYGDFVQKVAAGRKKTPAEIHAVAQGRVWTGRDALRHGLIDRLGGLQDAVALAREKAGIKGAEGKDWHILEYPRRATLFDKLDDMFKARLDLTDAALAKMPELRRALHRIEALGKVSRDRICLIVPELGGLQAPFARR